MVVVTTPMRVGTHWIFNTLRSVSGLPADYWHKDEFAKGTRRSTDTQIVRSHYAMPSVILKNYPDTKIICVMRDIRDVLVSLFFYLKHDPMGWNAKTQREKIPLGMGIKEFICSPRVEEEIQSHIDYWNEISGKDSEKDRIYTIRYVEMVNDPYDTISRLASFCGFDTDPEVIKICVDGNGFRVMSGRQEGSEKQDAFYRKGIVGDYKNYLDGEDLEHIDNIVKSKGGDVNVYNYLDAE